MLADPDDAALARPGGRGTAHGMLSGHEIVAAPDWRAAARLAARDRAVESSEGAGLDAARGARHRPAGRRALDRGDPHHLAAAGAHAYMYARAPRPADASCTRSRRALRRTRGPALERSARDAVLAESWPASARALYRALYDALVAAAPAPAAERRRHRGGSRSPASACVVSVLNPHASGGGGERFMRQLVEAMARHRSAPQVRLIAAVDPGAAFDAGVAALGEAGVDVRRVPAPSSTASPRRRSPASTSSTARGRT